MSLSYLIVYVNIKNLYRHNKTLKSNEFIIPHITTTQNKNAQEKLFSKWLR